MGPDGSLLLLDRTNQRSFGDRNEGREQAALEAEPISARRRLRRRGRGPSGPVSVANKSGKHQCPTAAAPFSPTRTPSSNRDSLKGAIKSGVVCSLTHFAICSPETGPALKP